MPSAIIAPGTAAAPHRGGRLWLLLFLLIGIALPVWLIEQLLHRFESEQERVLDLADRDRARALMAHLNRHLDLPSLVDAALDSFAQRAGASLEGRPLTPERARLLTRRLFHQFPASTRLIWFDREGRLVQPVGFPAMFEKTAWQAVYRTLAPRGGATPAERRLAAHQITFTMGTMATPEYLRDCFRHAQPILYKGEGMLMAGRLLRPPGSRRLRSGGFLLFVPTGRASFGWELARAVRRLSSADARVGGYWQSRQNGYGDGVARADGLLNPGLMHGLLQKLENGQGFHSHGGFTFLARFWSQDPDLVLIAAVRQTSPAARQAARLVRGIHGISVGLLALSALVATALGFGRRAPSLRLATRFRLGTLVLTVFPLLFLSVWGLDFLVKSAQHREAEVQQELEALLLSVEQAVAQGITRVQQRLRKMEASSRFRQIRTLGDVKGIIRRFEALGATEMTFARHGGRILTTLTERRFSELGTAMSLHYLTKRILEAARFRILGMEKAEAPQLESLLAKRDILEELIPNARLRLTQFGGDQFYLYSSVGKTPNGDPDTFFMVMFNFDRFCQHFFQTCLASPPRQARIFLRALSPEGIRREPRQRQLKNLLDLVQFNQELITMRLAVGGRTYLARGRPLAGLGTVGAVVVPFDEEAGIIAHSWRFLALFGMMTLGVALYLSGVLERLLLHPVLTLREAMDELERGNYAVTVVPRSPDELGTLATGFNRLVEGLRQKSRMLPFLNRELVAQAQAVPRVQTERRQVAVNFSGWREFARLEAELPAEEAMALRSGFLARCEAAVRAWGGEIDKFLGDAAMAVFFPGPGQAPPEARAVGAALALRSSLDTWMAERAQAGLPRLRHGIGIAAGPVIAGHVGSLRHRLDFTVIGDTVNLAARLEKEAGRPGQPVILAAASVFAHPMAGIRLVPTSITTVRGRMGAITVFGVEPEDG